MELLLCHTPLHVLIGLLVAQAAPRLEHTFIIIEDSSGLHSFARSLVRAHNCQLHLLPGSANGTSLIARTLIQRANAKSLRQLYADTATTVFLFHDLRAESQALLNAPRSAKRPRFVILEDGIALYDPRGLLVGSLISVLKRKIAFGLNWKHARELGLHPALSEIRCFYPHLLRANLRHMPASALPTALPDLMDDGTWESFRPVTTSTGVQAVIALPHSRSVSPTYFQNFLESALEYCRKRNLHLLFKLHPSDTEGLGLLRQMVESPNLIPQGWPLELALLAMNEATTFIGARTSALHVIKKLCPYISCMYYECPDTDAGQRWMNFFEQIGIPPITRGQ